MHHSIFLCLAALASTVVTASGGPICSQVSLDITATATNVVFANLPDPNNATAVDIYLLRSLTSGAEISGQAPVTGTFAIQAVYCKPPPGIKPRKAIQLLVHGITYNKSMWAALGLSSIYNWHKFAGNEGYHTLAIDRLSHGTNPDHPDPFSVVQGAMHIEVIHQLISALRSGRASAGIPAFSDVAFVGHSYGSLIANHLSVAYPNDVDAYVLTGFGSAPNITGPFIPGLFSAAIADPSRFNSLPLGYLTDRTEEARKSLMYAGAYDPAVVHLDFTLRDTVTIGELLSQALMPVQSPYSGPVFVTTGDGDAAFCHDGPDTCAAAMDQTRVLFPASSRYGFYVAPNTGHTLSLHPSAPATFATIHDWLNNVFH